MQIANRLHWTFLVVALLAASAVACQVPVFRYALERWNTDKYEVLVIHDAAFDPSAQAAFDKLKSSPIAHAANMEVRSVKYPYLRDSELLDLWTAQGDAPKPLLVVLYPKSATEVPNRILSSVPLTEENVESVIASPVRAKIAEQLSAGHSAVWIFVPCDNDQKNAKAMNLLRERIAVNQERLTVPTAAELEIDPAVLAKNKIPLRIEFSIVTVNRNDPKESFLLAALQRSEPDLDDSEPMAFPVFGRGRVLYGLVGDGIMPETIDTACKFISGPCSCQVKEQNPGFDLLMQSDWDKTVAGSMISDAIPDEKTKPRLLTIPKGRGK